MKFGITLDELRTYLNTATYHESCCGDCEYSDNGIIGASVLDIHPGYVPDCPECGDAVYVYLDDKESKIGKLI